MTLKKIERELLFFLNFVLNGRRAKTILFYPEFPHKRSILFKILKHLKFNITSNPRHKFDLAFCWEDATYREESTILTKFDPIKIMNLHCTDISKENISKIFNEVFGYDLNINPQIFHGKCVKKSNLNAKHDGIIIDCPVEKAEEGYVYQKILNNQINDELVTDIRTPVFKGNIPFVYLKYKKIKDRFTNDLYKSEIASVNEYLTNDETKKISEFCKEIGLDYGELDVLRNKDDGKIYIVDVNYTPWGPPAKLSEEDNRMAVVRLSEIFKEIFF